MAERSKQDSITGHVLQYIHCLMTHPVKTKMNAQELLTADQETIDSFYAGIQMPKIIKPRILSDEENEINRYVDETVDYFSGGKGYQELRSYDDKKISRELFEQSIWSQINSYYELSKAYYEKVFWEFKRFLWAFDVLTELVNDPDISDIRCLSYYNIRYKKFGKRYQADVQFNSNQHYERFVKRIAQKNQVSLSDQNAIQDFTDTSSSPDYIFRYNISTKLVNDSQQYVMHIRKINKHKKEIPELVKEGLLTAKEGAYLIDQLRNGKSIIVSGQGGAGKTSLVNGLIEYVDEQTSIVCIQENQELFSLRHPEFIGMHTVTSRGEGKIKYELKDLSRNSLTADINLFIIGEVKGEEARYLFTATNTGAQYIITVHAPDAEGVLSKIADYIKHNSDYTLDEAMRMLCGSADIIVYLDSYHLTEILEVKGYDREQKTPVYRRIK